MRGSWYGSFVAVVVALVALLAGGCGTPAEDAPDGGTIEFFPNDVAWTIAAGGCIDLNETFTVVVRNADGDPLNDVEVRFTAALAPGALEFVTSAGTDAGVPVVRRTTDNNGEIILLVHVNGCGAFADDVEARSGALFGTAHIDVAEGT